MEFNVADMSCGACASAISKAIAKLDATARVEIDVAAKMVKVESPLERGQIASAIEAQASIPSRPRRKRGNGTGPANPVDSTGFNRDTNSDSPSARDYSASVLCYMP